MLDFSYNQFLKGINMKMPVTFGNHKLPSSTMIMNMGSATNCPARKLGLCKVCKKCYALKAEKIWPNVKPYRNRQAHQWSASKAETIAESLTDQISRKRNPVKAFRFSESGDFRSQKDVDKMTTVCKILKSQGVKCYGYTARSDLKFKELMKVASVQGSGFMLTNEFTATPKDKIDHSKPVCKGDCSICNMCVTGKGLKIQMIEH